MGFPSPAQDYTEKRLSLDSLCDTFRPSVYLIRAESYSRREGIRSHAMLVVNRSLKPAHGSIIVVRLHGEFHLRRVRLWPEPRLESLDNPACFDGLNPEGDLSDGEQTICFGVVTHVLNDLRVLAAHGDQ